MIRASELFNQQQHDQVQQTVADAESKTSCEIVPVVASTSGRYDRAEDIVGLWFATIAAVALWLLYPRVAAESGSWGGTPLVLEVLALIAAIVVTFVLGVVVSSRTGWLRRLFTPRQQMEEEVAAAARQVFFDNRVHHTAGSTGILIYVSLLEHQAMVLGDQQVIGHETLGQPFLDQLCEQLTAGLHQGDPTSAICEVINTAGTQLSAALPREAGDVNELHDALVLID
ncbi:MAG: TPM domain-containing protein [Pirellulales bacterium]